MCALRIVPALERLSVTQPLYSYKHWRMLFQRVVDGIVLKTHPSGDNDLVVKLLTLEMGKISAIAKGVRRYAKRIGVRIDLLDRGQITLAQGKGSLLVVKDVCGIRPGASLATQLEKFAAASLLAECFDELLLEEAESQHHEGMHELLALTFDALREAISVREILRSTHIALASLLGHTGILESESLAPSRNNLLTLLALVERYREKQLKTRAAIELILLAIDKPEAA